MDLVTLSEEQRNKLTDEQLDQLERNASVLKSGAWGDCVVSCDGFKWRLHSDVLCSRSGYFRAAFQGGFAEGQYHFLNLQEVVSAYFLSMVILYIYLSVPEAGFDLEMFGPMDDARFYALVLELYRHAAYLQVEDLKIAIMRALDTRLDVSTRMLFRLHPSASNPALFKKALQDTMTAAVAAFDKSQAYYEFYEPVRAKFFAFVQDCYPVLCRLGDEFEDHLRQAPELSLAILKTMRNIEKSSFITPGPAARCKFCDEAVREAIAWRGLQPRFGITADSDGNVRYHCGRWECFRKIRANTCFK